MLVLIEEQNKKSACSASKLPEAVVV